jgi:hypothetical protein
LGFASADGVTRALASVCSGIFFERERRACRAASFADWGARSNEGAGRGGAGGGEAEEEESRVEESLAGTEEVDWHLTARQRGVLAAGMPAPRRAWSNWPLHREGRILFMWEVIGDVEV